VLLAAAGLMLQRTVLSEASSTTPKIAYQSDQASDERGEGFQIFVANSDGSGAVQVTPLSSHAGELNSNADPALSPDGTKVAFSSNASGNAHIVVTTSTGAQWTNLTTGAFIDSSPTW